MTDSQENFSVFFKKIFCITFDTLLHYFVKFEIQILAISRYTSLPCPRCNICYFCNLNALFTVYLVSDHLIILHIDCILVFIVYCFVFVFSLSITRWWIKLLKIYRLCNNWHHFFVSVNRLHSSNCVSRLKCMFEMFFVSCNAGLNCLGAIPWLQCQSLIKIVPLLLDELL